MRRRLLLGRGLVRRPVPVEGAQRYTGQRLPPAARGPLRAPRRLGLLHRCLACGFPPLQDCGRLLGLLGKRDRAVAEAGRRSADATPIHKSRTADHHNPDDSPGHHPEASSRSSREPYGFRRQPPQGWNSFRGLPHCAAGRPRPLFRGGAMGHERWHQDTPLVVPREPDPELELVRLPGRAAREPPRQLPHALQGRRGGDCRVIQAGHSLGSLSSNKASNPRPSAAKFSACTRRPRWRLVNDRVAGNALPPACFISSVCHPSCGSFACRCTCEFAKS
mmetsp:Transcript_67725/g.218817  ORF Transcript_67725/g.218817 Transcript_67725/m.218817 type:complete len:277 (+) Transcript_67725:1585-2415(+)